MYKMSDAKPLSEQNKEKINMLTNVRSVLFYALSLTVALGFNDLILTVFDSFPNTQHIISKTTYVVIMFGVTLLVAHWLYGTIKS
jgi:hypothetical protein